MSDGENREPPSRKLLNARARGQALIDLSRLYPAVFRKLYLTRKREQYAKVGVALSRRHVKHRDDGTGFCGACGDLFPCAPARRRMNRNGNGNNHG